VLPIITLGNETLHKKKKKIINIDDSIKLLADEMIKSMHEGRGIGLAAPQVDRLVRMFVTGIEGDKARVFINPELVLTSQETEPYEEGCLSIPGLYADVVRSSSLTIQAYNERGRPFTIDADGILARVILHELDHLNGLLFIDRLSEPKRNKIITAWEKKLRA